MIYVVSSAVGLAVGIAYGLIGLRSPAPPVAALLGLLGMLAGENAVAAIKTALAQRSPGETGRAAPTRLPTLPDRRDRP